ncbi:DUF6671 family protein [Algoriphagus aquatilis]|uniref:DUF6671 family protein n=1 Tax=Algoriphagus aquatilis TaxID=490186 RepID=A0ABW0BVW8_9BACT
MGLEKLNELFAGRKLVIATKHGKESVLKPLFDEDLGVECEVTTSLDTDLLGTFSGEIERTLDPISTARRKCELAMDLTGADLALASEGSFGAHPSAFFLPANEEWLLFLDRKNQLEVHARHLSMETNFAGQEFSDLNTLEDFAQQALFPSHGLILRNQQNCNFEIYKGITDQSLLLELGEQLLKKYGNAYVETDMRAHLNPTRMKVIKETAQKLLEKIRSCCPSCSLPGFAVVSAEPGLPCSWCGTPTRSILFQTKTCTHCGHTDRVHFPQGKTTEDPMYCDRCNP